MIRAPEYFAPLRTRHISLQQWERGQLFESWGSSRQGGRGDKQKARGSSGEIEGAQTPANSEEQHHTRGSVKRVIARSVSLSAAFGRDNGPERKTKVLKRGLSFSRSLMMTPSGEIIPEESDYDDDYEPASIVRNSSPDYSRSPPGIDLGRPGNMDLIASRSLDSSLNCIGSEIEASDSVTSSSASQSRSRSDSLPDIDHLVENRPRVPRPWARRFFSGGLLFAKDRKFHSGAFFSKSFERSSDVSRSYNWDEPRRISSPHRKNSSCCISQDVRFRGNFFTRMLSFSRPLDSRGEISSKRSDPCTPPKEAEIQKPDIFHRKSLSSSMHLDPGGEVGSEISDRNRNTSTSFRDSTEIRESGTLFGRDRRLSFSRSLDPDGEISSDCEREETQDRSQRFGKPEIQESQSIFEQESSFSRSPDPNVSRESLLVSESSEFSPDGETTKSVHEFKAPELSWSKKFAITSKSGFFFTRSLDSRSTRYREGSSRNRSSNGRLFGNDTTEIRPKRFFGRGFSLSFSRSLDHNGEYSLEKDSRASSTQPQKVGNGSEFRFKNFFTKGLFSFTSKASESDPASHTSDGEEDIGLAESSDIKARPVSRKLFSRESSGSRSRNSPPSSAQLRGSVVSSTNAATVHVNVNTSHVHTQSSKTGSAFSLTSLRGSRVLKSWWSKRSHSTAVTSKSVIGKDKSSRLVLLEKAPKTNTQEADNMTVYVGERGESLTKYVLTRKILRHHLFQVLLKCSQDELGTDHDYNSGVPIICDPALFLQVARVVSGNFSAEAQSYR